MKESRWIWYPGDFEIYHGMVQNFSREERGFRWPAYWHIDDCRKNVKFINQYCLEKPEPFSVSSHSMGYLLVNGVKRKYGEEIQCEKGTVTIEAFAGQVTGVPSIYVEGETIRSDESWKVTDFAGDAVTVGYSPLYTEKEADPSVWEYQMRTVLPEEIVEEGGGLLFIFSEELNGTLEIQFPKGFRRTLLCYGESKAEAMDTEKCYYSQLLTGAEDAICRRAFRYIFIPGAGAGEIDLKALNLYTDIPIKAGFRCNDPMMNRIWETAQRTFQLCSEIFFVDGIKRDRWIWAGDAYQSYYVNQYLMFDEEINKRTMWALRGNDPVRQHINTITDYSMLWIISIYNHYFMTGDLDFVKAIYPKITTMMDFLEGQLDENGFFVGRPGDWIFLDWTEMDKDGPVCGEQMLLAMCYKTMETLSQLADSRKDAPGSYNHKLSVLLERIDQKYWREEKGAYIDSFTSGKDHVTRHANIFAVLFGFAVGKKKDTIRRKVLLNQEIPAITTPYFKFYELEALCLLEERKDVKKIIKTYWGGMLDQGAVTFWEEYDPDKKAEDQYEMYGDPYGKSLCHGWAASPIYLIGRYFIGLKATDIAYRTFVVEPDLTLFDRFDCHFPIKGGTVAVKWDGRELSVQTDRNGGILKLGDKNIVLKADELCKLIIT